MEKETIQLSIDNVELQAEPYTAQVISESIKKRDSEIENLKQQLATKKMSNESKEYLIDDTLRKFDSMDALFAEMNPMYKDMKTKCDEFMKKYNDMKGKYNDMKGKCDELKSKCDELTSSLEASKISAKKDSDTLAELETLKGENLILKEELSKRNDAELINQQVTERCNLITDVSTKLKLDAMELSTLSNKEIKIKAIQSTCELPVNQDMDESFINGAFAIAMKLPRSNFDEEKQKIENIKTKPTQKNEVDEHFKKRIDILNGVIR